MVGGDDSIMQSKEQDSCIAWHEPNFADTAIRETLQSHPRILNIRAHIIPMIIGKRVNSVIILVKQL